MGKIVGDCRLCRTRGVELINGHIMSKAAYRGILETTATEPEQTTPVLITPGIAIQKPGEWKEYLLCRPCEDRFSIWEKYVFALMSHAEKGTFPWLAGATRIPHQGDIAESPSVDVTKVSKFAASIFWRLHHYDDSDVSLGPRYEEEFRTYLLDEAPFPCRARLAVILLDGSGAKLPRIDRTIHFFESLKRPGHHVHQFAVLGVHMKLFVGVSIPAVFLHLVGYVVLALGALLEWCR